jgi:tetratricopeptide (TPR) repeat protein
MNKSFRVKFTIVFFAFTALIAARMDAEVHNAEYYYERSNWKTYRKDYTGAVEDLNTAIKLQPNNSRNYNARGIAYERCGNYEAAMADFEYALKLNPYSAEARHNIKNLDNKINNTGNPVPQTGIPDRTRVEYQTHTSAGQKFPAWNTPENQSLDNQTYLQNQADIYTTYPQSPAGNMNTGTTYRQVNMPPAVTQGQVQNYNTYTRPLQTGVVQTPFTGKPPVMADTLSKQNGYRQTNGTAVESPSQTLQPAVNRTDGRLQSNGMPPQAGGLGQFTTDSVNYYTPGGVMTNSGVYNHVNSGYTVPADSNPSSRYQRYAVDNRQTPLNTGGWNNVLPRQAIQTVGNAPVNKGNAAIDMRNIHIKKMFIDPAAENYNYRGTELNGKERFDEAIEQFNAAINAYPEYAVAYNNRGVAFAGKGDLKRAAEDFDRALRINPYYYDAQFNREYVLAGRTWR